MAAESMWPGMFQAFAGRGSTRVRSTRDAISDTAASYAISDEQGARKKVLDNRQRTAVNRAGMAIKTIHRFAGQLSSRFFPSRGSAAASESFRIGYLSSTSSERQKSRLVAFQQGLT